MMGSWQQRLADCTFGGFTPQKDTSASRFTIGVRDRGKEQPRHITNLPEVLRKLAKRYPDAIVEPMSPVGMNLQAQAKVGAPCHRTRALSAASGTSMRHGAGSVSSLRGVVLLFTRGGVVVRACRGCNRNSTPWLLVLSPARGQS